MAVAPLVNGVNYSWSNVTMVWYGVPVVGIRSISFKRKVKKDNNYGAGSEPISRGYGNAEYECSIEIFLDQWNIICQAAAGKDPLAIPPQDVQIVFGGTRVAPKVIILQLAEPSEDPVEVKQGDTVIAVKIPMVIAGLVHKR